MPIYTNKDVYGCKNYSYKIDQLYNKSVEEGNSRKRVKKKTTLSLNLFGFIPGSQQWNQYFVNCLTIAAREA